MFIVRWPSCAKLALRIFQFDLIAGLPGQTPESWRDSLEQQWSSRPEHVSMYLLEVDEKSRLGAEF